MSRVRVSPELELEVEERGPADGPPLLLIMGIGAQLIHWPDPFVERLAGRGLRVIRFDNRDVGRSSKLDHLGAPPLGWLVFRGLLGLPVGDVPYRLEDMAGDAAALLDALGHPSAHVVGISMGGMIAQSLAIAQPARVRSLTSLMSSPGGRWVGRYGAIKALLGKAPRTPEEAVAFGLRLARALSGPGFPVDEAMIRELSRRSFERGGRDPRAFARQLGAIAAAGPRAEALGQLRAPTLVIHGADDPLVPLAAGRATAAAVPGARLVVVPGLGHSLPAGSWPILVDEIVAHVEAAQARARAA
jgi:pimeloyl-ACP methyl ester carboxylesterase